MTLISNRFAGLTAGFALTVAASTAPAQVDMRCTLAEGDVMAYTVAQSVKVTQQRPEEDEQIVEFSHLATFELSVDRVAEDGSATIDAKLKRLVFGGIREGEQIGYRWLGEGNEAGAVALPLGGSDETFQNLGELLRSAPIVIRIDPKGEITEITGLEEFGAAFTKQEAHAPHFAGFFTPRQLAGVLQPVFQGDGATLAPRKIGGGWQTTQQVIMPPVGAMLITNDWTLNEVVDGEARIGASTTFELQRSGNTDGAIPQVQLGETSGNVKVVWDTETHRLNSRIQSQSLETYWQLGDLTLRQLAESRLAIEREE